MKIMECKVCGTTDVERFGKHHKSKCKACLNEYARQWRLENPDYKKRHRERMEEAGIVELSRQPEYRNKYARKYYRENKLDLLNLLHARRAGTPHLITRDGWRRVLDFYGAECMQCGSEKNITMDHIVPISKGGEHSFNNIQILCHSCNSAKRCMDKDHRPYPRLVDRRIVGEESDERLEVKK